MMHSTVTPRGSRKLQKFVKNYLEGLTKVRGRQTQTKQETRVLFVYVI